MALPSWGSWCLGRWRWAVISPCVPSGRGLCEAGGLRPGEWGRGGDRNKRKRTFWAEGWWGHLRGVGGAWNVVPSGGNYWEGEQRTGPMASEAVVRGLGVCPKGSGQPLEEVKQK